METKKLNWFIAGAVFLVSLIQLTLTCQSSVPFWDCGEYAAAAIALQINHPPGVPLFMLLCRICQMIPIGDPGWRTNMLSVVTGALSVGLFYLISVDIILMWRKKIETTTDMLLVFGASAIGALAFTFSDSFWFNSVETEIYTPGMCLIALEIWLAIQWYKHADEPNNERYILLIAYCFGLGTTLYMFTILPLFMVVMIIYFRKYQLNVMSFLVMCGVAVVMFISIYPGIVLWLPTMLGGKMPLFKTTDDAGNTVPFIQDSPAMPILAVLVILGIVYFFWWSRKEKKNPLWSLASLSFLCVLMGYMTFTIVLLRSNANPPLNENQPDNFKALTKYLSREQYGNTPLITPRRYDHEPMHAATWDKTKYKSDWQFFWKYQVEHMYIRYFNWQFIGRAGDVQDAPAGFKLAVIPDAKKDLKQWWFSSSYDNIFPIRFFGIPFLLGILGMLWHFKRDWKMGLVWLAGFLVMGIVATLVQNQQDAQPRERDYFYVGSFFIYAMWIGFGALAIFEWMEEKYRARGSSMFVPALGVAAVLLIVVDVNMAVGGWKLHDRNGNYLPWDYSYNILQSCAPNAILFTEGDNDTFPLWYLQDVVGVRRDIRIANLSLGQTAWYVNQLKNERPWGTDVCPISISQDKLDKGEDSPDGFYPEPGEAHQVTLPVPRDTMANYTNDSTLLAHPAIRFTYSPSMTYPVGGKPQKFFSTADQLVFDIVKTNAEQGWKRPIYWSVTCSPNGYVGLSDYTRMEGLAERLIPVASRSRNGMESIDEYAMEQNLMHEPDKGYNEPHYGFRFRNLNNPHLYMDEVHRRMLSTYRSSFLTLANNALYKGKPDNAEADSVLNMMNEKIPHELFPMPYELLYKTAMLYQEIGDSTNFRKYSKYTIDVCNDLMDIPGLQGEADRRFPPIQMVIDMYEMREEYGDAIERLNSLLPQAQGSPEAQRNIQQKIYELQVKDDQKQGKYTEGIAVAQKALAFIGNANDQNANLSKQNFLLQINEMRRKAGLPLDSSAKDTAMDMPK